MTFQETLTQFNKDYKDNQDLVVLLLLPPKWTLKPHFTLPHGRETSLLFRSS